MTPRQRRKRRIVSFFVRKDRVRKAWQQVRPSARRFSAAMAQAYKQAREQA